MTYITRYKDLFERYNITGPKITLFHSMSFCYYIDEI